MPTARPPTDDELEAAARRLGRTLVKRGWQMACAESCTGGLVGHVITGLPGSSDYFLADIVSYSNAAKQDLLGVSSELLEGVGAVSPEVAEAMAVGALDRVPAASLTVAVTGIAGPDGGSTDRPVGLAYVAASVRGGTSVVERFEWPHDRAGNKRASALAAVDLAARLASEG